MDPQNLEKTLKFLEEHNIKTPEQLKQFVDNVPTEIPTYNAKGQPNLDPEGGVSILPLPGFVIKLKVLLSQGQSK